MIENRESESIDRLLQIRVIRLKAASSGLVTGLIMGIGLFVATNWLVLKGGDRMGEHLRLLSEYFLGYDVTFLGSLVGFVYAALLGYVLGYSASWLYNRFVDFRHPGNS